MQMYRKGQGKAENRVYLDGAHGGALRSIPSNPGLWYAVACSDAPAIRPAGCKAP